MTTSLPSRPGPGRHAAGLGIGAPARFGAPMATTAPVTDGRHHRPVGMVAMQRIETGTHPAPPAALRTAFRPGPAAPEGAVPAPTAPSEPFTPHRYPTPGHGPRGTGHSGDQDSGNQDSGNEDSGNRDVRDLDSGTPISAPRPPTPGPTGPQPDPGRSLATAGVVLGVLGLLVGILCAAVVGASSTVPVASAPPAAAAAAGASTSLRYEVTGSGTGVVAYTDDGGAMGQETAAALPWSKDFSAGEYFNVFTVSVTSIDGGAVGCTIIKDGAVISARQASGPSASAVCSGS